MTDSEDEEQRLRNQMRLEIYLSLDEKLDKELLFARGFAPEVTNEQRLWREELEAEAARRKGKPF